MGIWLVVCGLFSVLVVLFLEVTEDDCVGFLVRVRRAAGPEGLLGIADGLSAESGSLILCPIAVEA